MGTKGSFLGVKRPGRETTHLHLVPRSKNDWRYTSIPQYVFIAWCLVKHRDNFTFTGGWLNCIITDVLILLAPSYRLNHFKEYRLHIFLTDIIVKEPSSVGNLKSTSPICSEHRTVLAWAMLHIGCHGSNARISVLVRYSLCLFCL